MIIPDTAFWHHEKAQENIGKEELHLLSVGSGISLRSRTLRILIVLSPLEALWGQLVRGQTRTTSGLCVWPKT